MTASKQQKTFAAVVGSAALAMSISTFVGGWEGKSNDPYQDIIGKWTVCYGETNVAMRRYTDAECREMLDDSLIGYAEPVIKRTPAIIHQPGPLAAATSFSYNLGNGAYATSTTAKRFAINDWKGGCAAIGAWNRSSFNKLPVGKSYSQCLRKKDGRYSCVVSGLDARRKAEQKVCYEGIR